MSPRSAGRPGSLPPPGYQPRSRVSAEDPLRVLFVPEGRHEPSRVFDFGEFPVADLLQAGLAAAFAERSRAGGRIRAAASADRAYRRLHSFAAYLATLNAPPLTPAQLAPAHLDGWYLQRQGLKSASKELAVLVTSLRKVPGLSSPFTARLSERLPRRVKGKTASYSSAENQRILRAARADVRTAAARIRASKALTARWRAGGLELEPAELRARAGLIAYAEDHDDVPRDKRGVACLWVSRLGTVEEHVTAVHLSAFDVAAFAVLLVGLTGQNPGTITGAPAAHHRPDGYTGAVASAIVELDKPRRGRRRYMDVPLVDLPSWIPARQQPGGGPEAEDPAGDGDDLRTAFGVYMLLHELAAPARTRLGSGRLFAWWACTGGQGAGRGLRDSIHSDLVKRWARARAIPPDPPADGAATEPGQAYLQVTLARMRLTFTELHQKPVAHTGTTLANEYLLRNRGNIGEYRSVVADALRREVAKARTHGAIRALAPGEVAEAREHPARVAARHGMDAQTLTRLLAHELDTVMAGCAGNTSSPHSPAGQPCQASFMLCLSCPCARAAPHHLPLQVLVHDELGARRSAMTPLRWTQRYALPHAQLADLLQRAGSAAVTDARQAATPDQRRVAARFLDRELDQR